jgi:hypothetical protein
MGALSFAMAVQLSLTQLVLSEGTCMALMLVSEQQDAMIHRQRI